MKAQRYGFNVLWSDVDQAFVATCPDFPDLSAFGGTPEDAVEDAMKVLDMYVEEFEGQGVPLPPPTVVRTYSGQLRLRLPAFVHAQLAQRAEFEGVSLNSLINTFVVEGLTARRVDESLQHIESGDAAS